MKLLYITNGINGAGGLERVLSIKTSYLADFYDYDITILSLNEEVIEPFYQFSEKINFVSIPVSGNPFQYFLKYRNGIINSIQRMNPDVISVCDDGLKAFFLPIILSTKIPIVYERHVSKEIELQSKNHYMKRNLIKIKWLLMDKLGSSFQKFVVLTEGNKKEWPNLKNLVVIPNPLSFFPNQNSSLNNKRVLSVGRQSYQKGFDLLLISWVKVAEKNPDWILEIYGKIDPNLNLEQLAQDLGIAKYVKFYEPVKHIQSKYLQSSIYVMSSRFEGFGMVLTEAMACGVPCVSFDCNYGPSDIIQNKIDGFLVENGNTDLLAEKLCVLIQDENSRTEMGRKAKKNVKRFLPENVVKEWDILFKSLMK